VNRGEKGKKKSVGGGKKKGNLEGAQNGRPQGERGKTSASFIFCEPSEREKKKGNTVPGYYRERGGGGDFNISFDFWRREGSRGSPCLPPRVQECETLKKEK